MPTIWSAAEVERTVADYLAMLRAELAGVVYSKAQHRRRLAHVLEQRSPQSIEFKHANISAVLIELGFPFIAGYKPRSNYQGLLREVVATRLQRDSHLLELAAVDAERPMAVPEVDDILAVLSAPPCGQRGRKGESRVREVPRLSFSGSYLEREARNQSLGAAGEAFVINYERAWLVRAGCDGLAAKIEHTSHVRGDGEGYDILSFDPTGAERLIEVKATKYGMETPFFVSTNELAVSEREAEHYHLYRLFAFQRNPSLFILDGSLSSTCLLSTSTYVATVA